ncbi:MAG: Gfo/Idh/MocA family oxidoreductase [Rhodospirillaceae bacterium]|jgi:phthalate 4,5-cis-dihydrodiol dehydrogenase|nr:Gfo/Idh/MocA family oxidoreductase [Rhodospirillaceae bacterium]MBT5456125.1 Gfo/Idh/MocA family oxidoreductase [Rhodospirillaceae bacterium]
MADSKLKLGVVGLGRGFTVLLPTLAFHPRLDIKAAADTRAAARDRFKADFGGTAHESIEAMCDSADIDAVYIATPHFCHADHAIAAAKAGKHVLVEKPMALSVEDCTRMIDAAADSGVHLLVGPSHSYDAPMVKARRIIDSGAYGPLHLITGINYTDFIYRPRRPDELDSAQGGGVVYSQASHQIDVTRFLAGGMIETIYATTGNYDPARPTEGAYSAMLKFASGVVANLTFSGYGHFDSDEFCGWRGETGGLKDPANYGAARRALSELGGGDAEATLKADRAYGGRASAPLPAGPPEGLSHEHFGLFVLSCARCDIRPLPDGVRVYADDQIINHSLAPPTVPRAEVIDELCAAILDDVPPLHTGAWGRATFEACEAVIQSATEAREIRLSHQVATGGPV